MRATARAGGRLHVGFQNLSLAHERLYGGLGLGVAEPQVVVTAEPADEVSAPDERTRRYAERTVATLDVPGAAVEVERELPRHVGLGSGTQLALAVYAAIARAHGREPTVSAHAPVLGRGGRSGVGVATFERGGFVVDAGHPTTRFTTDRPPDGEWTVPPVVARHPVPDEWRFVLAIPDGEPGRSGDGEDESMRAVVERADPGIATDIGRIVAQRLLPALVEGRREAFGDALSQIGRLNGAWYADEQGGVFRPPVGSIVESLSAHPAISGTGQSSWGPTVYGLTDVDHADEARGAARDALDDAGVDGDVRVVAPDNEGATVSVEESGEG